MPSKPLGAKNVGGIISRERHAMKVADVMTENPSTVEPNDTIGQADEIMNQEDIRQLPVV